MPHNDSFVPCNDQQPTNTLTFLSDTYRRLPPFKGKKRLGQILFSNAVFERKDRIIRCKNNLKFHLLNTHDSVGRDLFFDGIYEPATLKAIEENLLDGDVFIDAGANIGAISLPVAKKKNVRTFSFEPATNIFKVLKKNQELNKLDNVITIPMGLSDREGVTDFYESARVHGWSGMVRIDSFQKYKVSTTTLDNFTTKNNIERIAVLKADVQGWEYYVFKGSEKLLDEKRIGTIIFEFEWWAEKNAGLELGAAQQFLLDKGYFLFHLNGKRIYQPFKQGSMVLMATSMSS